MDTSGGRWQAMCEQHSTISSHRTLTLAMSAAADTLEFCETCRSGEGGEGSEKPDEIADPNEWQQTPPISAGDQRNNYAKRENPDETRCAT
jgi:hypothetical protein